MAIGEFGLAIWLLIKGGKETRVKMKPEANNVYEIIAPIRSLRFIY